jgi:hypothetical protein
MILVILGAGASFDSVSPRSMDGSTYSNNPWRPPMASDLFSPRPSFQAILNDFPECRGVIATLRERLAGGAEVLEEQLAQLQERSLNDQRSASQLMAIRFYIRRLIDECETHWFRDSAGVTNYHALVEALDRWARTNNEHVLYVTFNYDSFLERAVGDEIGLNLSGLGAYVNQERFSIFKLHGSVDWGYPITDAAQSAMPEQTWVIRNAADLVSRLDVDSITLRRDWSVGTRGSAWVPALAVPVRAKSTFQCPNEHLARLRGLLPYVDRLLVIGWRSMEEHFLAKIEDRFPRELRGTVLACGSGSESQQAWSRINAARRAGISIRGSAVSIDQPLGLTRFDGQIDYAA